MSFHARVKGVEEGFHPYRYPGTVAWLFERTAAVVIGVAHDRLGAATCVIEYSLDGEYVSREAEDVIANDAAGGCCGLGAEEFNGLEMSDEEASALERAILAVLPAARAAALAHGLR